MRHLQLHWAALIRTHFVDATLKSFTLNELPES